MDLPKKIKVAGYDIDIIEWEARAAFASDKCGEFSSVEQVIRINTSSSDIDVANTFFHEISHAIYWAYNIEGEDDEERTVTTLTNGWIQVYRDNPEVLIFLQRLTNGL